MLLHAFEQRHGPWLFFPSRLARCPRDRRWHERTRAGYLAATLDEHRPRIERARRKLRRLTGENAP